ncbi:MAG: hypothetical protein AAGJ82_04335 [Bacteroidota bacterium]
MQANRLLLVSIAVLLPVALLLYLGAAPFIDDEANRALVAMEMLWSGNYVTPTMHADYYYNKPPLWNWIVALSFTSWGNLSEWAARFPSVLALLGFAGTIYYYCRKHFSWQRALLVALAFLTCGRVLYWESMLGLIDLSFSWAMFTLFMVVYHAGERQNWVRLFVGSYVLMTIGFMFKGLPAFVFQGATLLTYLVWRGEWRRLFSAAHIGGGLLSVALLALYYWQYHRYNSLENVFHTLFVESGKRTAVAQGVGKTITHLLSFPFVLLYHFSPWSLLLLLAFNKRLRGRWHDQPFVRYCLLAFGANIIVYWLSPNFYPRYVLMLMPLLFIAGIQLLPASTDEADKSVRYLQWVVLFLLVVLTVTAGSLPWLEATQLLPQLTLKSTLITIFLFAAVIYYYQKVAQRWYTLVVALLIFRVGYDVVALPLKAENSRGQVLKADCERLADRWQDQPLAVFHESLMEPAVSFYTQRAANRIIPRQKANWSRDQLYLYNPDQYADTLFTSPVDSLKVRHATRGYYYLARLRLTEPEQIEQNTLAPSAGF